MLREVKRIVPLSAAKMAAAVYGGMGIVLGFPLILATVLPAVVHARQTGSGFSAPVIGLVVVAVVIIVPILYAVLGFVIGIVGAAIYNLVAKWLGGLQIDAE